MDGNLSENEIRVLFKQAIAEVLEERRDLFYDLFAEVIEDFGLANAIREGYTSERVDEDVILGLLERAE